MRGLAASAAAATLLLLPAIAVAFVVRSPAMPPPTRAATTATASAHQEQEHQRRLGIIVCDHGSRRAAANDMLSEVAQRFLEQARTSGTDAASACAVEVAHMELAEPTIEQAFDRCVAAGATAVVCHPFFLSPGRHVSSDIPQLMEEAASKHPEVSWMVSEPLGLAKLMPQLMNEAVTAALSKGEWQR